MTLIAAARAGRQDTPEAVGPCEYMAALQEGRRRPRCRSSCIPMSCARFKEMLMPLVRRECGDRRRLRVIDGLFGEGTKLAAESSPWPRLISCNALMRVRRR